MMHFMHGHQKSLYKTSALLYILSNLIANRRLTIDLGPGTGVLIIGYLYPPSMLSKSIIKKNRPVSESTEPGGPRHSAGPILSMYINRRAAELLTVPILLLLWLNSG